MTRPNAAPPVTPTNVAWSVGHTLDHDGQRILVVLSLFTPMGEQHVFFDIIGAKELSAALEHQVDASGFGDPYV